jgi:hypothetical protein
LFYLHPDFISAAEVDQFDYVTHFQFAGYLAAYGRAGEDVDVGIEDFE